MDELEEKRAFEGLRRWIDGVIADPPRLRFYSHVALVALAWFLVLSPLTDRMRAAEKSLAKARKQERLARSMEHLVAQREAYLPLLTGSDDVVDWQNFVLAKVDAAGVRLSTFEPSRADKRGPYVIMNLRIAVQSQSYEQLADFLDRLEHGERLVRVEQMIIDQTASALLLTLTLRGLAKPGLDVIPLAEPVGGGGPAGADGSDATPDGDGDVSSAEPVADAADDSPDDTATPAAGPAAETP